MTVRQARYSSEDAVRMGEAIYEDRIRPLVEEENKGKYVAIDIESGAWEMGNDEDAVSDLLQSRLPNAEIYVTRVGFGYVRRIGVQRGVS